MEDTKIKCNYWFCPVFPLALEDFVCSPDLTVPHVLLAICFVGREADVRGLFDRVRMKS